MALHSLAKRSAEWKAFILHAQSRIALAVIRSLGKRGITVIGGEEWPVATCFYSRYCTDFVVYHSPRLYPDAFFEFLLEHVRKHNYDVIFPRQGVHRGPH